MHSQSQAARLSERALGVLTSAIDFSRTIYIGKQLKPDLPRRDQCIARHPPRKG